MLLLPVRFSQAKTIGKMASERSTDTLFMAGSANFERTAMPSVAQIRRKIDWRLIPFLAWLYLLSFLDRVNLGNVHAVVNAKIGLSEYEYGYAVGVFFVGYVMCEVPSNIMLRKTSPSRWIARILLTWGILSTAMAFATSFTSLIVVRYAFIKPVWLIQDFYWDAQKQDSFLESSIILRYGTRRRNEQRVWHCFIRQRPSPVRLADYWRMQFYRPWTALAGCTTINGYSSLKACHPSCSRSSLGTIYRMNQQLPRS
jgi:hypothetical protein